MIYTVIAWTGGENIIEKIGDPTGARDPYVLAHEWIDDQFSAGRIIGAVIYTGSGDNLKMISRRYRAVI